jgi:hypothetical protein
MGATYGSMSARFENMLDDINSKGSAMSDINKSQELSQEELGQMSGGTKKNPPPPPPPPPIKVIDGGGADEGGVLDPAGEIRDL